ncbi:hypothetical protein VCHENC02_5217B, partial [Vibrio harveyi]|jgi:hypothetical protein
LHF